MVTEVAPRAPEYVNIAQASKLIDVGASSIKGWILTDRLPAQRDGGQWRIRVSDLMKANELSLAGVGAKQRARKRRGGDGNTGGGAAH